MSNDLAIATVTRTLQHLLQTLVARDDLSGAAITVRRPERVPPDENDKRVNIYLYRIAPNPTLRNADLPTRGSNGQPRQWPQVALDLHYLLSFYGNEEQQVPERMLGRVLSALHAHPLITANDIAQVATGTLAASDLADQTDRVKLMLLNLSLEELSKLWTVFFQTPYVLSVAFQASVVLIEAHDEPLAPASPAPSTVTIEVASV